MGLQNNDRLAAILLGFLFLGGLLACAPSPPYDAIPAPVTKGSGDADLAELLNSIRIEERLPGLAVAIIIDGRIHSAAAVGLSLIHISEPTRLLRRSRMPSSA